jgi:crossover junction endodeoxyribonuclease RusA
MMLVLPYPPSVNHYWKHAVIGKRAQVYVSKEGKAYQAAVQAAINPDIIKNATSNRLSVRIELYPPDRRARDIDNVLKSLNDSLTKAGVWVDDSQIDELTIKRMNAAKPGYCTVTITELTQQNELNHE